MIIANTTFSVAEETATDWLRWMKTFHLTAVMNTGLPQRYRVLHLLTELDNEAVTYTVQFDFATRADYDLYLATRADAMQQRIQHRFGGQFVSFDTLLEEV